MPERILITGVSGFIGTWLAVELAEAGHEVLGIDRHDPKAPLEGFVQGDLLEPRFFNHYLSLIKPDRVVHLAAQVGRLFGEDDLINTVSSNALMTTTIASACGQMGVPLAYTSTSEVYGDQGPHRICNEDGPMVLPHNLYGLTKRWGEEVCQLYAPRGLVIFRPSMPYGPGAPPGRGRRAMDNMLWQALHRKEIIVHRGAERSWCWIGDTVRAMRMILEATTPGANWEAYNVGRDDTPVTMLEIAERSCRMTNAPMSLIHEVDPPDKQTVVKKLSTERIRALGWKPTVELVEGMHEVLEWIKHFDAEGRMVA